MEEGGRREDGREWVEEKGGRNEGKGGGRRREEGRKRRVEGGGRRVKGVKEEGGKGHILHCRYKYTETLTENTTSSNRRSGPVNARIVSG